MGSSEFIESSENKEGTSVHIEIDGMYKGRFVLSNLYRSGLKPMISKLKKIMQVDVVTGDGDSERQNLLNLFGPESQFQFNMSPMQKLEYVRTTQYSGNKVLMIGDGLNDAGAISESHVGISISDNIFGFLPSCDAILEASFFERLSEILSFSKASVTVVKISFGISFLYNLVGMYFAVQGLLSPVVAAIFMPLSSISVAGFAILSTNYLARSHNFYRFDKTDENHKLS
jgi:Cu+-exporting ATPase